MSGKTRLKRLNVSHYGALSDIDLDLDEGLNAFYGKNESGKTLLVESITKMLVDDTSSFDGIGRISQQPSGLLTVDDGDREFDVSQESIEEVFDDVTAEDVRNAFIIRDFDLRLPERSNDFGNGDYFRDVTDRVLGSRTRKIEDLRDEIAELSYLTNSTRSADLENRKDTGKLRDKKQKAEKLRGEINDFLDTIEQEGLFQKYGEIDSLEKRINSKEKEIGELQNAEKQAKYDEGRELLEDLRDAERRLEEIEREKKDIEELRDIRDKAKSFEEVVDDSGLQKKVAVASSVLSGLSLGVSFVNPSPVFAVTSVIFLASAGYSIYSYRQERNKQRRKELERNQIIDRAEAHDIDADTLAEVVEKINDYLEDLDERETDVRDEKSQVLGELKGLFSADLESSEEWNQELDNFSNSFESVSRSFEEGDLQQAREELEELRDERDDLENELDEYDNLLNQFEKGVSQALDEKIIDEEPVDISSVQDLDQALKQLDRFISSLESMVEASTDALEILEEMEAEEEDEFNKVFNDGSYAVEMFHEATGGNYTDINYDKSSGKILVERKDGRELEPQSLSQGTYDLLYMSVRLKLAREILGEPGFLVLDNAFVHSDVDRIEKELEFLIRLEDEGWQIIYFTFRDDVRKVLEEKTGVRELENLEFQEK